MTSTNRIAAAAAALALLAAPAAFAGEGTARDARASEHAVHCAAMTSEHGHGARHAMVHERAAACACRAPKARASATDPQQAARPYDPWSDLSHGYRY